MAFYLSPGVYTREKDFSQIIPAVNSSVAAISGASNKGPSFKRTLVTSDQEFLEIFGKPNASVSYMHYSALAFLKDSNQLWVTRVHNGALFSGVVINKDSASANASALSAGEDDPTTFDFSSYTDSLFAVFAENEGTWGNNISVEINSVNETDNTFNIAVYELQNGNNVLVETWTVSREEKVDGNGSQLYLEDRINDKSKYIRVKDNTAEAATVLPKHTVTGEVIGTGTGLVDNFVGNLSEAPLQRFSVSITDTVETFIDDGLGGLIGDQGGSGTINYSTGAFDITFNTNPVDTQDITADYFLSINEDFTQGGNGAAVTNSNLIAGWDLYSDPDQVDVRILIGGGATTVPVQQKLVDICESRKDCISVLDLPADKQSASAAIDWRRNVQNFNTSYAGLYGPHVRIFDEFNDKELLVPPSGHVAGVYARNDFVADPWFAPAGLRRGKLSILGVDTYYDQGKRDILYPNGINPIRVIPGQGKVVWGQRTLLGEESALSRVNVRRLLIVLEKAISIAELNDVFEINDDLTRLLVKQKIDAFLQNVKDRRGLYDFLTVVDTSNNTPTVIDNKQMNIDVFLKPTRSAEAIQLTAIITRTGASFEELIAAGALA